MKDWTKDSKHMAEVEVAVDKYSRVYNIPKDAIYAQIKAESDFNPYATPGIKNNTSVGLMQVNDGAMADVVKAGLVDPNVDRTSVDGSIALGTAYLYKLSLSDHLKPFKGRADYNDALIAAYHEGAKGLGDSVAINGIDNWKDHISGVAVKYVNNFKDNRRKFLEKSNTNYLEKIFAYMDKPGKEQVADINNVLNYEFKPRDVIDTISDLFDAADVANKKLSKDNTELLEDTGTRQYDLIEKPHWYQPDTSIGAMLGGNSTLYQILMGDK